MTETETPAQARRRVRREQHEQRERELDRAAVQAIVATTPPLTEGERLEFAALLRPRRKPSEQNSDAA